MKLKSWNGHLINDGTIYLAHWGQHAPHGLPAVEAGFAPRSGQWPGLTVVNRPGRLHKFTVYVRPGGGGSSSELAGWFDPHDETAKQLVVEDAAGGNDRYVMAICERFDEVPFLAGLVYQVQIRIHDDVFWRKATPATDSEAITASGQTWNVVNNGAADAYPSIKIKPTTLKTSGFSYKQPIFIVWRATQGAIRYPTDLTNDAFNTSAEIGAGRMQADGDDLRVYVNGVEVDRWLDGINTTTTKVWAILDFAPAITGSLATAIAASGAIATIDFSTVLTAGQFANLPPTGAVRLDSEVLTYTGKINQSLQLTGITRAARGTSEGAHLAGAAIYWLQHEIEIRYGDATLSAPTVDPMQEPIINLATSTNASWDYDSFGTSGVPAGSAYATRPGAWQFVDTTDSCREYTANRGTQATPWSEIGIAQDILGGKLSIGRWEIWNPCFITNANFANGEKYSATNLSAWYASIQSRTPGGAYTLEDTIAAPSALVTWEAWSDNQAIDAGSDTVILQLQRAAGVPAPEDQFLEVADVTLTLDSSYTPVSVIGSRVTFYPLSCRITNNTTGEAIDLDFSMALNQQLAVDTDARTVTYLADGSNQFQALELVGGPRKDWLKLAPGTNQLQFDETDLVAVTVDLEWEERHYN